MQAATAKIMATSQMPRVPTGGGGKPPTTPPPTAGGAFTPPPGNPNKSPNALIEDAIQRGRTEYDPSFRASIRNAKNAIVSGVRETFVTNPLLKGKEIVTSTGQSKTRFFASAIDRFRTLHSATRNQRAEAQKTVQALFKNANGPEYDLAKRYIVLRDAYENIQHGNEGRPGFDEPSVVDEINRLQKMVDQDPNTRIVLDNYKTLMNSVRDQLVAEGFNHKLDRDWYFPHTLIDYALARGAGQGKVAKILGITAPRYSSGGVRYATPKASKQRTGSARDISTNLVDQLENYLTDVYTQIEKKRVLTEMYEKYDVRNTPNALDAMGKTVQHVQHAEQIPPGYVRVSPMEGTARLRASSMAERYLGEMMDYGGLDDFAKLRKLDPVAFRQALDDVGIPSNPELIQRLGASILPEYTGKTYVVPKPLAETVHTAMDQLNRAETMGLSERFVRGFKTAVLNFAPVRYNVRNLQGDLQRMYAQFGNEAIDPGRWRRVARSLTDYYRNDVIDPLMQQMLDHGVSSSGRVQSEHLLSRVDRHLKQLEHGVDRTGFEAAHDAITRLVRTIPEASAMREDLVRGVLVDMNMSRLAGGKEILHGVADPQLVQGLMESGDTQRAVSYIARKSLLDYGDFTPRENKWRNGWFPFYAWASGNFQFWTQLAKMQGKGMAPGAKARLAKTGSAAAVSSALKGTAVMATVLGSVRLWNEMVMGDYEEELPENTRSTTHFIIPDFDHWQKTGEFKPMYNDEGRVRVWSTRDALDDFLTDLGLDHAVPEAFSVLRETLPMEEYLRRQREYAGFGPGIPLKGAARTVLGQLGPREQMLAQMVAGKRLFPDPLHPSDIPPDQRMAAMRDVLGVSAVPGVEGMFGNIAPGTDIFQPATKMYDIPKQLGFGSYREPSILTQGNITNPGEAGRTVYEADLIKRIKSIEQEKTDLEGQMKREYGGLANRQLDSLSREKNFAARQAEIQEKVDKINELMVRLDTLQQRTARFHGANPR